MDLIRNATFLLIFEKTGLPYVTDKAEAFLYTEKSIAMETQLVLNKLGVSVVIKEIRLGETDSFTELQRFGIKTVLVDGEIPVCIEKITGESFADGYCALEKPLYNMALSQLLALYMQKLSSGVADASLTELLLDTLKGSVVLAPVTQNTNELLFVTTGTSTGYELPLYLDTATFQQMEEQKGRSAYFLNWKMLIDLLATSPTLSLALICGSTAFCINRQLIRLAINDSMSEDIADAIAEMAAGEIYERVKQQLSWETEDPIPDFLK